MHMTELSNLEHNSLSGNLKSLGDLLSPNSDLSRLIRWVIKNVLLKITHQEQDMLM